MHSLTRSLFSRNFLRSSNFNFTSSLTLPRFAYPHNVQIPFYSKQSSPSPEEMDVDERIKHMSLLKVEKRESKSLTTMEKVVRTGKDVSYSGVILLAFAVTGALVWVIFNEFFSGNSLNSLFTRTLKLVRSDEKARRVLGEPIRGFGEHTGWNRRRGLDHAYYKVGESHHIRMEFNAKGQKRMGRVSVDLAKDARGRYQVRYLLVELEGRPGGTLVLQDNR